MNRDLLAYTSGIHNIRPNDTIPVDALSESYGWIVKDGQLELMRGRERLGADGGVGSTTNLHVGFKANGSTVLFRKITTKIQYWSGTAWTDVITGLTDGAPTKFTDYQSLAGAFVYIFSTDGIYKIATANPGSFTSLYDSTKNFKGLAFIDKGRSILWGRAEDQTGLYGSWIDNQSGVSGATGVYTTVTGEVTAGTSGTLAFKGAGATRTCFGVQITITASGQVYTDNYNGILTGSLGGTGTINYTTGAWTVTAGGAGTANYQWENSNLRGVTDFSKSATRLAGEGFIFRQDYAGDGIKTVIPLEGTYYSIKGKSIYALTLDSNDTTATNEIFRINAGISSRNNATATSKGIILLDTADGDKPIMRIITRNPVGDNFDMNQLFPQFDFALYNYDQGFMYTFGDYALLACRSLSADANDSILMCNFNDNSVMVAPYEVLTMAQDGSILYTGDSLSANVYKTFNGFDDLGYPVENIASGMYDNLGTNDLKRTKKLRLKGLIQVGQSIGVYVALDNGLQQKVGTINGNGSYVDIANPTMIGGSMIGESVIGSSDTVIAYPYYIEMKLRLSTYQKRQVTYIAEGIGYATVRALTDYDIWLYPDRMPKQYRLKQNVDIDDSTITDQ